MITSMCLFAVCVSACSSLISFPICPPVSLMFCFGEGGGGYSWCFFLTCLCICPILYFDCPSLSRSFPLCRLAHRAATKASLHFCLSLDIFSMIPQLFSWSYALFFICPLGSNTMQLKGIAVVSILSTFLVQIHLHFCKFCMHVVSLGNLENDLVRHYVCPERTHDFSEACLTYPIGNVLPDTPYLQMMIPR